jgi:Colicin V production protein
MAYWVIFCIIMFAAVAMMVREGLWSNTITLINIFISGIVAFGFYSAIVVYLDEDVTSGQHTYWLDFAILWALFAATMVVCRSLTAACSKTRMRFKHPIDPVGGPLVAVIAAWVLACFTMATLHVAPMGKEAFGGKLVYDVASASPLTQPDVAWLRFFETMSKPEAFGGLDRFGASGFVKIYGDRRAKFDKAPSLIVKRGSP